MEVLTLIDKVKNYDGKRPAKLKPNQPLEEYSGKTPDELRNMLRTMLKARRVEREEKLLLRKGYNRFFIGCGGKELIDVCLADAFRPNDPMLRLLSQQGVRSVPGLDTVGQDARGDRRSPVAQSADSRFRPIPAILIWPSFRRPRRPARTLWKPPGWPKRLLHPVTDFPTGADSRWCVSCAMR